MDTMDTIPRPAPTPSAGTVILSIVPILSKVLGKTVATRGSSQGNLSRSGPTAKLDRAAGGPPA